MTWSAEIGNEPAVFDVEHPKKAHRQACLIPRRGAFMV